MPSMLCCAGRAMADGEGVLADGTAWERTSGEERGKNGFWLRWTSLRGVSSSGKVQLTLFGVCRLDKLHGVLHLYAQARIGRHSRSCRELLL